MRRRACEDPLGGRSTAARELYGVLVGPVEPLIHSAAQMIIVPDGSLHEINFETLVVDGVKPHYWIDDATVALVPSLSILRVEKRRPGAPAAPADRRRSAPADPEFPPLPHLKAEIREIAADFPADRPCRLSPAPSLCGALSRSRPGRLHGHSFRGACQRQ